MIRNIRAILAQILLGWALSMDAQEVIDTVLMGIGEIEL